MKLTFDRTPTDHKPDNIEYPYRVRNMVQLDTEQVETILYLISRKGYAYKDAATMGTKERDFTSQELLTLDFDSGIAVDAVVEKCKQYDFLPTLIYYTFSHTAEHSRFRLIFHLDEVITDYRLAKTLRLSILELFPEADQIQDVCHVYQGSTNGEWGFKLNNCINPHAVIIRACEKIKGETPHRNYFNRTLSRKLRLTKMPRLAMSSENTVTPIITIEPAAFSDDMQENLSIEPAAFSDATYQYEFAEVEFQEDVTLQDDKFDWTFLEEKCELWREANSGKHWMTEPELFFFAASLKGMKGSVRRLNELVAKTVKLHPNCYSSAQVQNLKNAIKTANAMFRRCDGIKCPYREECEYRTLRGCQPVKRDHVQRVKPSRYVPLEKGEQLLEDAIEDAFTNGEDVTIIKAQTGIGKTTKLLAYLQAHPTLSVCLAVPTHKLKDEIMEKVAAIGLDFEIIPELDISKLEPGELTAYNNFLKVGDYAACKSILNASKNQEIMEYCRLTDNFNRGWIDRVIITHKRALLKKQIDNDVLVIDEDILMKSIETFEVDLADLEKLRMLNSNFYMWLSQITSADGLTPLFHMNDKPIREILDILPSSVDFNIHQALKANLCYVDRERGKVTFATKNQLPKCKKIIILSATVDDYVSRYILYPTVPKFVEIPRIEPKGCLYQYIDLPSSRTSLSEGNLIQNYKRIQNVLPKQNLPMITFKKFEPELVKNGFEVVATFGGVEGLNFLEGTDIEIVGTYRTLEIAYLLFAKLLDDTVETRDLQTSNQTVQYNGFRFNLYTFDHPIVQQAQLYMINSELEQCVGRARLLRNPNNVHLVAKLPLHDAIIKNLQ